MPKIHGASASPFVRKVRVAMTEKNLPYELVPLMPFNPTPEFKAMSPMGKIPIYQDGAYTLPDSSCIIAYLERVHPTPALYPSDPKLFGTALFLEEYGDTKLVEGVGAVFFNRVVAPLIGQKGDEAKIQLGLKELLPPAFQYLESIAPDGEGLVGGRFGIADIAIASPIVNLGHSGEKIDKGKYPRLAAYIERVHARPSFKALIEEEQKQFAPK